MLAQGTLLAEAQFFSKVMIGVAMVSGVLVLIQARALMGDVAMQVMVAIQHAHNGKGLRRQPQHDKDQNQAHRAKTHSAKCIRSPRQNLSG